MRSWLPINKPRHVAGLRCRSRLGMEDVEQRTIVPLLNGYKYGLARRRLLQTATGGLRLQRAPCYVHLLQIVLYFSPLACAAPFIITDALRVWNEYYLSLISASIYTLLVFALRLGVYCVRRYARAQGEGESMDADSSAQFDDEDGNQFTSCISYNTLYFITRSKHIVSLFLHSLLVCGILSFTSTLVLLPRVLIEQLPTPAAVVVGITGWLVSCGAHYSLNVNQPHETAVYRPTDLLGLGPLLRPAYLICLASTFIAVRLTVSSSGADVYLQLLYAAVCVLPLCWVCGVLPPLDALIPWAMQQSLTRLMGGSHMATDLRLLVVFLLSAVSAVVVAVTGQYGSTTAALLLASLSGYLLSQDIFLSANTLLSSSHRILPKKLKEFLKPAVIRWKVYLRHLLVSVVKSSVLLTISLLLVYFSLTAKDSAKRVASKVTGSCLIALTVLLRAGAACQGIYLLGLVRNPLHPWWSENVQRYNSWRKRLSYCSIPRRLMLTYVSPLVMLVFVSLAAESDVPNRWLSAVTVARIFRKVWQNAWGAQLELSVVALLLLALPQHNAWAELGVGTQALVVGLSLEICGDLILKLCFAFTLFLEFIAKDRKKTHCRLYTVIITGSLFLLPLTFAIMLLSSVISAPLLPLFTLPIFAISFPRTRRFWPSLFDYGSSYNRCRDSVYYQQDAPVLSRALGEIILTGSTSAEPGDYFLLRYQDRIVIAAVLERGHGYLTLNLRGLEMQETSCHTIEAARIDDIFSDAYNPGLLTSLQFWFNTHPLNTMQPVDSAVVSTYSDARSVLTGIIDQPPVLHRFSSNLLKCIVWVLYHHVMNIRRDREELSRETEGGSKEKGRGEKMKRGRKNKVAPTADSERATEWAERANTLPHTQGHTELWSSSRTNARSSRQKTVAPEPAEEDSLSWTSIESVEERHESRDQCIYPHLDTIPGLIPVDVPLDLEPSVSKVDSSNHRMQARTTHAADNTLSLTSDPRQRQQLPIPPQWLQFPLLSSQIDTLLRSFPEDWLSYLSVSDTTASSRVPPMSPGEALVLKQLCLTCFSIVDVPLCSLGAAQTRPFHIHSGFCGEFPYSTDREWLTGCRDLHTLVLKAYRYAVKLLCDETVFGEAGDSTDLADYLQSYQSEYHIGSEGEPEWDRAILDRTPHLFSIGKSPDDDTYTARALSLQDQLVHVGKLNSAAVHAVWSDLALELLYLTNDDEERYSIQAHPSLLRNLTIQAADPPLGYAVHSSGIIRSPHVT